MVTLHDLSVFHFPDFHPRDRVNYLREQIHAAVERADHLVTDSGFVRTELLQLFQLSEDRVTAIPLGWMPPSGRGQALTSRRCWRGMGCAPALTCSASAPSNRARTWPGCCGPMACCRRRCAGATPW